MAETTSSTATPEPVLTPRFPPRLSVKVVGLGGVGSIVAEYAGLWLNARSGEHPDVEMRLVLIDGDDYQAANTRMHFSAYGNKAEVKQRELVERLGDRMQGLSVEAVGRYVDEENVGRLIHEGDVVLACVDRHASRRLLSQHAATLRDAVVISAGNDGVGPDSAGTVLRGTYGNCQVYVRRDGADVGPPLVKYHPEIAEPADVLPTASCGELVASVPQLLFANFWAAGTILTSLYLVLCDALPYWEVAFDIALGRMLPVELPERAQQ